MFLKGISKRTSGSFKPDGGDREYEYDFVKLHVLYEFGVDDDCPEMAAGDAVDIIKVGSVVWKRFLDKNGLTVSDAVGLNIRLVFNKYGKVSGISIV